MRIRCRAAHAAALSSAALPVIAARPMSELLCVMVRAIDSQSAVADHYFYIPPLTFDPRVWQVVGLWIL
jgi:hypothetical protein